MGRWLDTHLISEVDTGLYNWFYNGFRYLIECKIGYWIGYRISYEGFDAGLCIKWGTAFLLDQIGFDTGLDAGLNSGLVYWIECRIGY